LDSGFAGTPGILVYWQDMVAHCGQATAGCGWN
jgi:hypothetical protein